MKRFSGVVYIIVAAILFGGIGGAVAQTVFQPFQGGTGISSYTAGDIIYSDATNSLAVLAKGSDTEVLTLASGIPSWAAAGGSGDPILIDGVAVSDGSGVDLIGGTNLTIAFSAAASPDTATFNIDDAFVLNTGDVIYKNDAGTFDNTSHLVLEQDSTGDTSLKFLITAGQAYSLFVDNDNGDTLTLRDTTQGDNIFNWDPATSILALAVGGTSISAPAIVMADGTLIDLSAVSITTTTEGLILPKHATDCSATGTAEGQVCWEEDDNTLWIGDGATVVQIGAGVSGDITDVFNCSSGNCASIVAGATDLLDFSGNDASTLTEGLILPQHATACATGVGEGQVCWESDANILHIGDGVAFQNFLPASAFSGEATVSATGAVVLADTVTTTGWVLGTASATIFTSGTVNVALIDGVGAVDIDYGSGDITDHTFVTDGTGTAEIVLPAGSIDSTEILDATIVSGDVANDTLTYANILDSDQADTKCIWFEDPVAGDDFKSIWANKTANDFLLTELWAESDQTVTFMLQVDDGTPADIDSVDLAPAAGEAEDTSLNGDTTVAAGEELDLDLVSVANIPTFVSICFTGNWVD